MFNNLWNFTCTLWLPFVYFLIIAATIILLIRFTAKKKRTGVAATLIVAALLVAGGIIYVTPHYIVGTDAETIYKIEISEAAITDKETIKAILDDLNNAKYKRALTSGIGGYSEYSLRGYDENGNLKVHIEIKDEQTVDTGRFWETRTSGKLNLSLYQDAVLHKGDKQD